MSVGARNIETPGAAVKTFNSADGEAEFLVPPGGKVPEEGSEALAEGCRDRRSGLIYFLSHRRMFVGGFSHII